MNIEVQETQVNNYPAYKYSEVEWLGEIPEHWGVKRFKHVFNEKKKVTNIDLNCGSISFGKVIYKDDENIPESTKRSYQVLSKGEFLINPLNLNYDLISLRIALSDKDVVVSSGYIVINNVIALNKHYYKWLLHIFDIAYMKTLGSGVRQTLSFNHIANSEIVFPPLTEQQAIANFLDDKCCKIDAAIEIKQKQIALLKERRQVAIHQAVTRGLDKNVPLRDSGVEWIGKIPEHWEVKKLKQLIKINNGVDYKHIQADKGFPVIGSGGQFAYASKYLYDGEVILLGRKGTIDKPLYFEGKFWTVDTMFYAVPNKTAVTKYLYYVSTMIPFKLYGTSTALPSITQTDLNNHKVAISSLSEQLAIVAHLEELTTKMDTAISIKQQEIEKLKEYKTTIINSAVTGKIKVPGVN